MLKEKDPTVLVPPKTKTTYEGFKPQPEIFSYKVFEAKSRDSHEKHLIRALDCKKDIFKNSYSQAATLFLQELLSFQSHQKNCVLINRFEISDNGRRIACATRYPPESRKNKVAPPKKKMEVRDRIEDLKILPTLNPTSGNQNIYFIILR